MEKLRNSGEAVLDPSVPEFLWDIGWISYNVLKLGYLVKPHA